jgi:hypothetical protein
MPATLRKIEFLGGPWDGGFYLALDDEQRITAKAAAASIWTTNARRSRRARECVRSCDS